MVIRIPGIKWNSFAVGAAASLVGGSVLHSALVMVAKAGMGAASTAQDVWTQASSEMARARAEAAQPANSGKTEELMAELRALRSDIAAVKTKVGLS